MSKKIELFECLSDEDAEELKVFKRLLGSYINIKIGSGMTDKEAKQNIRRSIAELVKNSS